jgi:branched-chain amino acid aminotransferase
MAITTVPVAEENLKPLPTGELVFGRNFTDHMFTQNYTEGIGWHDSTIKPYGPFVFDPATAVLHYAQEIFEGLKAYRRPNGNINLFRPDQNALRFNRSAVRMAMPEVDVDEHVEAIIKLVDIDQHWVPKAPGSSLYIRPTMIATQVALGVAASKEYLHFIIQSPVGVYFKAGFNPVSVYISDTYRRAVRGGVGEAKTGGNYASSLFVSEDAAEKGYSQVLWLDAVQGRFIEEVGAMNIMFAYENRIVTPALTGSILPGITRMSVIELARDLGYELCEEQLDVNDILRDIKSGEITEVFGCGTAAVIAPVGVFGYKDHEYVINDN